MQSIINLRREEPSSHRRYLHSRRLHWLRGLQCKAYCRRLHPTPDALTARKLEAMLTGAWLMCQCVVLARQSAAGCLGGAVAHHLGGYVRRRRRGQRRWPRPEALAHRHRLWCHLATAAVRLCDARCVLSSVQRRF